MILESVESGGLEGVTLGPQRSLYSHPDVITSEGGFYLMSTSDVCALAAWWSA